MPDGLCRMRSERLTCLLAFCQNQEISHRVLVMVKPILRFERWMGSFIGVRHK